MKSYSETSGYSEHKHPLLVDLNDPQREAVMSVDGPLLVLAGPGSGKTRVVTHRIAWMLQHGVRPYHIAALTFTNKAADEMKRRLANLAPGKFVWIGTFHKFCAYIIRQYYSFVGLEQNFSIYDPDECKRLLDMLLDKTHLPAGVNSQKIASGISWAKNELVMPEEYVARSSSLTGRFVEKVYPAYQKALMQGNAVDFDDLLVHVANLLRQNQELRKKLDERFRYILVDEYQDTNFAQYTIARALSVDYANLAVTGDPDQSIYGWRGANIDNILNFERDFDNVKIIRLEQNYRSTQRILSAADAVISNNVKRKEKKLFTENEEGEPVRLTGYEDHYEEAKSIAQEIAREITFEISSEISRGRREPKDYAIFFRTNALSRQFEHALS
ncbi:MAG: ATP-dependent helicase, partial [Thermoguttaceae bacterium]